MTFLERFWGRVDKGDGTGCWEWKSSHNEGGYGIVMVQSPGTPSVVLSMKAHRFSYLIHYGPPPATHEVCHHCDNPSCVRPDHLFLGTHSENMRDSLAKGRNPFKVRTHCPQGHPYDAANTWIVKRTGHRQCRTCRARWKRESAARRYVKRGTLAG